MTSLRDLFEQQRKLAASHDPAERLRTLWIGVLLGEHLERCSNGQLSDLLSMVLNSLRPFSPEFAVCEHAKRRLLKSSSGIPERDLHAIQDAGIELLNAETLCIDRVCM